MRKILALLVIIAGISCSEKRPEGIRVTIKNTLDFDRSFETIEIDTKQLAVLPSGSYKVIDANSKEEIISQTVDNNADGVVDVLLFQPDMPSKSERSFLISGIEPGIKQGSYPTRCYSRFVPERTDDYAWENNRVAFRTFGPEAQKMKENGIQGGTLTSGMDAWLKRVEYPVINKWYKKHTSGKGSYHEDTGEGLDNFHVGISRGVGGTAVRSDSTYAVSKNFISYKTIANGPVRTSFVLEYANWNAGDKMIQETKHISLDYGQNLSRHIVKIEGTDKISVGLTLHKNDGTPATNLSEGWMSYWEPFDDSELGQGVVVPDTKNIIGFDKYVTHKKDLSNLFVEVKVVDLVEYYAGFGWKKSGQFHSKEEWGAYLSRFAKCLNYPLEIEITGLSE